MVIAHHVADDLGRLAIGLARDEAALLRSPQNAAVNGLQTVTHVGQRTRNDDRHCIVEIARLHLVDDVDRRDVGRVFGEGGLVAH